MKLNMVWTFWFALILTCAGTFISSAILMNQWNNFKNYSDIDDRPNYPLQKLSNEIELTLNQKKGNLEDLLLNNPISEIGDIYLIDSSGLDLLGRAIPEGLNNSQEKFFNNQPSITQTITTNSGELFFLIFRTNVDRPAWSLFKRFGLYWVIFAAFVFSGLVSWWLASRTVRPIQDIANASSLHGEGDFLAKINKKTLQRKDEIGELARQLQKSGMKIQELLKKQKDFLRDVSHEVRTPLARLQIATETLELDAGDEKSLKQIKEEVLIIDQLVQDLLHLSHFDRPSQSNNIETFSILDLIKECVNRSKIQAKPKDVSIKFKDENLDDINVKGIRFLLDRALDNVISNAIRHSPNKGCVEVRYEQGKDSCCLSIWDQGDGVNEQSLEEIFEPFVRSDASRNRQTGGFGLGLSLVKKIMDLHKGEVSAANHANGFVIRLIIPLS